MKDIIGIDSRRFVRNNKKSDGSIGHFESVLGVAVRITDYAKYIENYDRAIETAIKQSGNTREFFYYCNHDLRKVKNKYLLLNTFFKEISPHILKVHVFYTLFSKTRIKSIKVYGRQSRKTHHKLSKPTRSIEELINKHLRQCFPSICAWRLTEFFTPSNVSFHLDSHQGHTFEAYEDLIQDGYHLNVFPHGDCSNPVISTADLLIEILDYRLKQSFLFLLFDNIRPCLHEFGEKVLVYPIFNKYLPKVTPVESIPIDMISYYKHPVFWVFKGDSIINSEVIRESDAYRKLIDFAAGQNGTVKMFDKGKDIHHFKKGDYGVYLNSQGEEHIKTYKLAGKYFKPLDMNALPINLNKT